MNLPELFLLNLENNLIYAEQCKIIIRTSTNELIIEPLDETFETISTPFDWTYVQKGKFLFVFDINENCSYVLVLKNRETCENILNVVNKKKKNEIVESRYQELFEQKLLLPAINQLGIQKSNNVKLKVLINDVINLFEEDEKKKYLSLLEEENAYRKTESINKNENTVKESRTYNLRKRKLPDFHISDGENSGNESEELNCYDNSGDSEEENVVDKECLQSNLPKKTKAPTFLSNVEKQRLDPTKYKLHTFIGIRNIKQVLIIFASDDRSSCYEYRWKNANSCYYCFQCFEKGKNNRANFAIDSKGIDYLEVEMKNHVCQELKYLPEKYERKIILKKPNYEFKQKLINNQMSKILVIFISKNKNLCFELYWNSRHKLYMCDGCKVSKDKVKARIYNINTAEEYIEIDEKDHTCEPRVFEEEFDESQIVKYPNFELRDKTTEGYKTLIIFDSFDRNLCHYYVLQIHIGENTYKCKKCFHKYISAKIYFNDTNEPYVILSKLKHVCILQPYIPEKNDILIESTHFQFIPQTRARAKLRIYISKDQKMGYEFGWRSNNIYDCLSCRNKIRRRQNFAMFSVKVCERENGEKYISLKNELEHECEFEKFESNVEKKYENKLIYPPNFIFYCKNDNPEKPSLVIYDFDDRTLCYDYFYQPSRQNFICRKCSNFAKKIAVTAKALKDENGKEYLHHGKLTHICKPLKLTDVIASNCKVLESTEIIDFVFASEKRVKENEKIIKQNDFELRPNMAGKENAELLIFATNDRDLCYKFLYLPSRKIYYCSNCNNEFRKWIKAELKINGNDGEKYVIMNKNSIHSCLPIKYEIHKEELRSYNFLIFNMENETKLTYLIVFTSENDNNNNQNCYKYSFDKRKKFFYCSSCFSLYHRRIKAQICKDDDGKEYVNCGKINHLCTPQKYDPKKFQALEVRQSSDFEIFPNVNGLSNSRLLLFDKNNESLAFEYLADHNQYRCCECQYKNKYVGLRVYNNNNERNKKYAELNKSKHVCKLRNMIERNRMFYDFKIENCSNGNQNVTITDGKKKNLSYQFSFDFKLEVYCCLKCKEKGRFISYKIRKVNGNKEYLLLNDSHSCISN